MKGNTLPPGIDQSVGIPRRLPEPHTRSVNIWEIRQAPFADVNLLDEGPGASSAW